MLQFRICYFPIFTYSDIEYESLFSFLNVYLLSGDEAQEPTGEEAIVDDERHLSLYEPLRCQFPESSFSPLTKGVHLWLPLLYLCLALIKATETSSEDYQNLCPSGCSEAVL